jgi:hypothetical protein
MLSVHIEGVEGGIVRGWAFDDGGTSLEIEARHGGRVVAKAVRMSRPDVARVHPRAPAESGFELHVPPQNDLVTTLDVHFLPAEPPQVVRVLHPSYARYLGAVWAHFLFVRDYFPRANPTRLTARDAASRSNSPEEMLAIANHLYVLKASGVTGAFAEFGCFKGFSTSMLSHACDLLGIEMHVFDSFEGLPASDSREYLAGEFKGTLEEVRENVGQFGSLRPVVFHKGFFADSLRAFAPPPLMTIWMDVDLDLSARDVMRVFRRIDERGAIFSHECEPHSFVNGIHQEPHPNHVIPAILDAYALEGVAVEGRHIGGSTGAFWRGGRAIAPATATEVFALVPGQPVRNEVAPAFARSRSLLRRIGLLR